MEFRPKTLGTKPTKLPNIQLANGVFMPFMGLGTGGKRCSDTDTELALRTALDLGYRHIDTAQTYRTEKIVGKVIKEYIEAGKLKRSDIFITTKLPDCAHGRGSIEKCLRTQLADLQMDYVDLYLIHSPCAVRNRRTPDGKVVADPVKIELSETWVGMEEVYEKKLTRAIGLSNFNVDQIQRVYSTATIKPHNLQVEMHAYWPQKELVTLCQSLNVSITAYAPLGSPGHQNEEGTAIDCIFNEPILKHLALKYQKTPAQILLRHMTQRKIVVIPKSTDARRIKENLESMDFFLTDKDIDEICAIKKRNKMYLWSHRENHPEYPFDE